MIVKTGYILAFGELFLKSEGVKKLLIRRLMNDLSNRTQREKINFQILPFHTRLFVQTKDLKKTAEVLKNTFGLSWFSVCFLVSNKKEVEQLVEKQWSEWINTGETFALRFKSAGQKVEWDPISLLAPLIKRKVNLSSPDKTLFIERCSAGWLVYINKERGLGGLPLYSSGKALSLVSGGIDSPVSTYLAMKRGLETTWIHFHSFPLVSKKSIEKVEETARLFRKFQNRVRVVFIPFHSFQEKVKIGAPAKYRVLLYRRGMLRIAEKVAQGMGCSALITGESLGQVSSQTLVNLDITNRTIQMPILRPLIGMDKEEIISLSKKINSYDISIRPQEDCCTLFVSGKQTAAGKISDVVLWEEKLSLSLFATKMCEEKSIKEF